MRLNRVAVSLTYQILTWMTNTLQAPRILFVAAAGELDEMIKIVAEGALDIAVVDYDKRSALHLAASNGHISMVKYLLGKSSPSSCCLLWTLFAILIRSQEFDLNVDSGRISRPVQRRRGTRKAAELERQMGQHSPRR